ncbi:Uncharacterised protein [Mycobacteroides abscessus subsp. abscessus]|nr:Uncharacterised protein [Mycobacteroides abscessus subsp. abscessus]
MTDPAIEARAKAIARIGDGLAGVSLGYAAECGAREMAKTVQELHKRVVAAVWWHIDPEDPTVYIQCSCGSEWPCETAKRVYSSEELGL